MLNAVLCLCTMCYVKNVNNALIQYLALSQCVREQCRHPSTVLLFQQLCQNTYIYYCNLITFLTSEVGLIVANVCSNRLLIDSRFYLTVGALVSSDETGTVLSLQCILHMYLKLILRKFRKKKCTNAQKNIQMYVCRVLLL